MHASRAAKNSAPALVPVLVTVLLSALATTSACTFRGGHQLVASTIPVDRPYTRHHTVRGESCSSFLFYLIPLSRDSSARLAKRRALAKTTGPVDGLIDVSYDTRVTSFFPFYTEKCTVITGDPITFHGPGEDWIDGRRPARSEPRGDNEPATPDFDESAEPAPVPESAPKRPARPGEPGGYCIGGDRCNDGLTCDRESRRCVAAPADPGSN